MKGLRGSNVELEIRDHPRNVEIILIASMMVVSRESPRI